jgi:uncharacterized protein (DUF885 family)
VKRLSTAALLAFLPSCAFYAPSPEGREGQMPQRRAGAAAAFQSAADAALEALYAAYPERATADGLHDHDNRLTDWSRDGVERRVDVFSRHLRRVEEAPDDALPEAAYYDRLLLAGRLRAELFELQVVQTWRRDPNLYRRAISDGLFPLAALSFETPERRRSLAEARLRDVPGLLAAARANLDAASAIAVDVALEDFKGLSSFLRDGLAKAFPDPKTQEFRDILRLASEAVDAFRAWLEKDLRPKAVAPFALGADTFREKLRLEERVEETPEVLLERGRALLRATREELTRAAGGRAPEDALKELAKDVPAADKLLDETKALLAELRRWASGQVTLPEEDGVRVVETPAFRRATSFASMRTPGPFEKAAQEAFYAITLPEADWPAEKSAQHLSFFNRSNLALITVHEVWPGHYTQTLLAREAPTRVRKALGSAAFSEGWAHYCEQLYAEAFPSARLAQLHMALLRVCRYVAALEMHTRGMSVEKAAELFREQAWLSPAAAEREARRGAVDPLYLVYTLGKFEILRLREDWQAATGGSAKDFHDALLRVGRPPVPLARQILLERRRD